MPKKTIILILVLAFITVGLVVVALMPKTNKTPGESNTGTSNGPIPSPTPVGHTQMLLSPNPVVLTSTAGSVDVVVEPNGDQVSAVQIEISFDPKVLTNVNITEGTFFTKQQVLIKRVDPVKGTITMGVVSSPEQAGGKPQTARGTVATITFTLRDSTPKQTQITLLPTSLVSATGISKSVLRGETSTVVAFGVTPTPAAAGGKIPVNLEGRPF